MSAVVFAAMVFAADPAADLRPLLAVGREGAGQAEAAAAWKRLVAAGPAALVPALKAFDGAGPAAANWLRSAVTAVADAEKSAGRELPADTLTAFVTDTANHPTARSLAFDLLAAQDRPAADKLLPGFLDDASGELRRAAVAAELATVDATSRTPAVVSRLTALFGKARDKDQVEEIAKRLEAAGGAKPDLTRHFGYLTEWSIVGPLDGPQASGFGRKYGPDAGFDPAAKFPGKAGEVGWKPTQSVDPYGAIDLTVEIGKQKDCVAYAAAVLVVDAEMPCEIRLNSPNALRVTLNGAELLAHEEYHHGADHDQYVARGGVLNPGENLLLVKVCQNDQKEPWAQAWQFAARVCDRTGGRLPLKQVVVKDGSRQTVEPGAVRPKPPEPAKPEGKK
jgi:hypothetical protein